MKKFNKKIKRNLKKISYPVTGWLFVLLGGFARTLNREQARKLAVFLGDTACGVLRIRRSLTENNLKSTFPHKSPVEIRTIARQAYRNQALNVVELLRIPLIRDHMEARDLVEIEADDSFNQEVLVQNRGAVVVSAHLSSWEMIGACAGMLLKPLHVIIKPLKNHCLDAQLTRYRTMHGNRVILKDRALREGLKVLKQGKVLVILGDQSNKEGTFHVDFLGRRSTIFLGPAFLALKAGVPLFVETCRKLDNQKYQLKIQEIDTRDLSLSKQDIATLTIRYTRVLEDFIRKHPEEWLWMHDRWKRTRGMD